MTMERVRSAVRTDPVRRLFESAPSSDEVRSAISERLDGLSGTIGDGLDTLSESLGTVAERVDPLVEEMRERVNLPEQLADLPQQLRLRPAPPPRGIPRPIVAVLFAAAGLAAGFLVARIDRERWTNVRDRGMKLLNGFLEWTGARSRDLSNRTQGVAAVGMRSMSQQGAVEDRVLEERARSALGRARGLHAIEIVADDGVVTVRGQVEPGERQEALAMLRSVPGVRDVEDRLEESSNTMAGTSTGSEGGWSGDSGITGHDELARVPDTGGDGFGQDRLSDEIASGSVDQDRP